MLKNLGATLSHTSRRQHRDGVHRGPRRRRASWCCGRRCRRIFTEQEARRWRAQARRCVTPHAQASIHLLDLDLSSSRKTCALVCCIPHPTDGPINEQRVLRAANSIIQSARSYGFVCTHSHAEQSDIDCRIMDLNQLSEKSLEFSLVSRAFTRKAQSIGKRPQVTIHSMTHAYRARTAIARSQVRHKKSSASPSGRRCGSQAGASSIRKVQARWSFGASRRSASRSSALARRLRRLATGDDAETQGDGTPPATSAMWELLRRQRD